MAGERQEHRGRLFKKKKEHRGRRRSLAKEQDGGACEKKTRWSRWPGCSRAVQCGVNGTTTADAMGGTKDGRVDRL